MLCAAVAMTRAARMRMRAFAPAAAEGDAEATPTGRGLGHREDQEEKGGEGKGKLPHRFDVKIGGGPRGRVRTAVDDCAWSAVMVRTRATGAAGMAVDSSAACGAATSGRCSGAERRRAVSGRPWLRVTAVRLLCARLCCACTVAWCCDMR